MITLPGVRAGIPNSTERLPGGDVGDHPHPQQGLADTLVPTSRLIAARCSLPLASQRGWVAGCRSVASHSRGTASASSEGGADDEDGDPNDAPWLPPGLLPSCSWSPSSADLSSVLADALLRPSFSSRAVRSGARRAPALDYT